MQYFKRFIGKHYEMGYGNGIVDWGGPGYVVSPIELRNKNKEIQRLRNKVEERTQERNREIIKRQSWANVARLLMDRHGYTRQHLLNLQTVAKKACTADFNARGVQNFVKKPLKESPIETLKRIK
jgi:hypothetical protein